MTLSLIERSFLHTLATEHRVPTICQYSVDAKQIFQGLIDEGYIDRNGEGIHLVYQLTQKGLEAAA